MTVHVPVPGGEDLIVEHLVLDVNGTLTDRGEPIIAAIIALERLAEDLHPRTSTATSSRSERAAASPSATDGTTG